MESPIGFIKENTKGEEPLDQEKMETVHDDTDIEKLLDEDEVSTENESISLKGEDKYVIQFLNEFDTTDEFIKGLVKQWNQIKHYVDTVIDAAVKLVPELESKKSGLKSIENQDYALFKLIEFIQKDNHLYWYGNDFLNLETLGVKLGETLPEIQEEYVEFVKSGCFLDLYERTKPSEINRQVAVRIQSLIDPDPELALYKLFYLLTNTKSFSFELGTVELISDFIELLHVHKKDFTRITPQLIDNKQFLAWIGHKGYDMFIDDWKILISKEL